MQPFPLETATNVSRHVIDSRTDEARVNAFFVSDSTGISAETMGNALLLQFPELTFSRHLIPFITTADEAHEVVRRIDRAAETGTTIVFSTAVSEAVRTVLLGAKCTVIDFLDAHLGTLEHVFHTSGMRRPARLHGIGDAKRYNARMYAVEYALEHDDGQSMRALQTADVILLAPSRCGKTPTTMYLALQHGVLVANYPLVPEDLERSELPAPVQRLRDRCFGITTTPARLTQVRQERRPGSTYASLEQCAWELRRAAQLFRDHRIPTVDSSAKSVEEMSTVILQHMKVTTSGPQSKELGK